MAYHNAGEAQSYQSLASGQGMPYGDSIRQSGSGVSDYPTHAAFSDSQAQLYDSQAFDAHNSELPPAPVYPPRGKLNKAGSSRNKKWILLGLLAAAVIVIVIVVAVPVTVTRRHSSKDSKENAADAVDTTASDAAGSTVAEAATTATTVAAQVTPSVSSVYLYGGNGSTITMENGTTFTYINNFGGTWNGEPFNNTAQAQSYTPALSEDWDYTKYSIYGVNIGGWLCIEPFIAPSLFEPYVSNGTDPNGTYETIDEWTLSEALGTDLATTVTTHYDTFITEEDFMQIAAAGLNWVRLPIPYWVIETWDGEPMLAQVGWEYVLKAITWARKYGIRINLDFHAVPGSQNGYNHSSKQGSINFLNGVMGIANAQRTLNYIRALAEFIAQDEYSPVVPMFSVLNEPYGETIGYDALRHFYVHTYNMIRDISGVGKGRAPFIALHDAFFDLSNDTSGGWLGFMNGWDRVALDSHPYICFAEPNNDSIGYQASKPCTYWAESVNRTREEFGVYIAGEWSLAINDCGLWINNVGNGYRYNGTYYQPGNATAPQYAGIGSCEPWNDWESWSEDTKSGFQEIAYGHMDTFHNWFFWTWKTGYSTAQGRIANPLWNYRLGVEQGYMPPDPRQALGACPRIASENGATLSSNPVSTYAAWMTGGSGAGTVTSAAQSSQYAVWPPTTLHSTPVTSLPSYTATGTPITLSVSSPTSFPSGMASTAVDVGNGWFDASDTSSFFVPITSCSYVNPWSGAGAAVPSPLCVSGESIAVASSAASSATTSEADAAAILVSGTASHSRHTTVTPTATTTTRHHTTTSATSTITAAARLLHKRRL